jgi:hypothetical protein
MNAIITKKEIHVPVDVLIQVSDVFLANDITNSIIGTEEDDREIVFEVEYEKGQRDIIHEVEDIISDYHEGEQDDDDDENEEDDE